MTKPTKKAREAKASGELREILDNLRYPYNLGMNPSDFRHIDKAHSAIIKLFREMVPEKIKNNILIEIPFAHYERVEGYNSAIDEMNARIERLK